VTLQFSYKRVGGAKHEVSFYPCQEVVIGMEYRYLLSPLLFRITLKTFASTVSQDKKYKDSDWKGRVKTVL
jgi:hypothetical protein